MFSDRMAWEWKREREHTPPRSQITPGPGKMIASPGPHWSGQECAGEVQGVSLTHRKVGITKSGECYFQNMTLS